MPFHGYRGSRRRNGPRQVIQSYKKVINHAAASRAATADIAFGLSIGVDSIAAGQTGPTDINVPTGSVIKGFVIQYSSMNLVGVALFSHWCIQLTRAGQSLVTPLLVGGNPQRNQVFKQGLMAIGESQNSNIRLLFKIPKGFQRVREGDQWTLVVNSDQVIASVAQIIYKFFR